jgi:hypothetical protein
LGLLTWKIRPRASLRVINYYFRYLDDPESPAYSDYCRIKLILHYPFTDWPDLLFIDNKTYGSYIETFQACKRFYTHPQDFYGDLEGEGSDLDSKSGDEKSREPEDEYFFVNFEVFARRKSGADFIARGIMLDGLGSREIDRSYNWSIYIGRYTEIYPEVWEQIKAENPIKLRVKVDFSPEALNTE